jgi:uncharacterized protein YndB with AHSA1/START domain
MNNQPIVLERIFNAPISEVWKALTNKDEMKNWYFDLAEFKAEIGFKFQFLAGRDPNKQYLHLCEITEVILNKKLSYSWRYEGYAGNSHVTFELQERENQTLLKLIHKGIETLPKENADFAIANFDKGWNEIIHTSLRRYLEQKNY